MLLAAEGSGSWSKSMQQVITAAADSSAGNELLPAVNQGPLVLLFFLLFFNGLIF